MWFVAFFSVSMVMHVNVRDVCMNVRRTYTIMQHLWYKLMPIEKKKHSFFVRDVSVQHGKGYMLSYPGTFLYTKWHHSLKVMRLSCDWDPWRRKK